MQAHTDTYAHAHTCARDLTCALLARAAAAACRFAEAFGPTSSSSSCDLLRFLGFDLSAVEGEEDDDSAAGAMTRLPEPVPLLLAADWAVRLRLPAFEQQLTVSCLVLSLAVAEGCSRRIFAVDNEISLCCTPPYVLTSTPTNSSTDGHLPSSHLPP